MRGLHRGVDRREKKRRRIRFKEMVAWLREQIMPNMQEPNPPTLF